MRNRKRVLQMMVRTKLVRVLQFIIWFGCTVECRRRFDRLKVLTFNAGLEDASLADDSAILNNREQRRDAIIEYLNEESDPDFVCLQEVPFGQDVEAIVNGLRKKYPYSFSELHQTNGTLLPQSTVAWDPSCDPSDFNALFGCAVSKGCATGTETKRLDTALFQCVMTKCSKQFKALVMSSGEKCLACILSTSVQNLQTRCSGPAPSTTLWNMNRMGLLLLSKKALRATSAVEFYPEYINCYSTGYIRAKVAGSNLNIACVDTVQYLPYTFEFPPMSVLYPTYILQNAYEMQQVVKIFGKVKPLVIFGDFNVGPAGSSVDAIGKSNYDILTAVFTTKSAKTCTICPENIYNVGETIHNVTVDHILVNGRVRIRNAVVKLTPDEVTVGTQGLPLSYHYGVQSMIRVGKRRRGSKRNN